MIGKFIDNFLMPLILCLCAVLLCVMIYMFFIMLSSEKIVLRKENWKCVERSSSLTPIMVGKAIILQKESKCIEYKRT